jgi:hypothetical protein
VQRHRMVARTGRASGQQSDFGAREVKRGKKTSAYWRAFGCSAKHSHDSWPPVRMATAQRAGSTQARRGLRAAYLEP